MIDDIVLSLGAEHDQVRTKHVISSNNEICSEVTLISVKKFRGGSDVGTDSCFSA